MTDFAIVVGVSRYSEFENLNGPDNDALAVYNWLVAQDGGGLAPLNVKLIRSADCDPTAPDDPQPARARIEQALKWLETQTRETPGGRLYLYFSGHGFSPVMEEGALFTADATQTSPEYVYAHAWMRWFRMARRFDETILWMDSCMNYQQSIPVTEVMMRPKIGTGVPGPTFMALAAQTKSALEHSMPDGQVHGVFTWTLLQGLSGGAADDRGWITGESLRNFLYTVMPECLPDSARNSSSVDLRPFVRADEGLVFRRLPAGPKYQVRLTFPAAAVGAEMHVWTGRPLARVVSKKLSAPEWTGELPPWLYVVEVPAAGLRHGFQVTGPDAAMDVTRTGPQVTPPDEFGYRSLDIVADNPAASISVMDYRFERIRCETGELHVQDLPGVYKVRVEYGRDITMISEDVLLLDRDGLPGQVSAPQLPSVAPISDTTSTRERDVGPFEAGRRGRSISLDAGQSAISVLVRCSAQPGSRSGTAVGDTEPVHLMPGLRLIDSAGHLVADLSQEMLPPNRPGDSAAWERRLPPGNYYLRQDLSDGRQYEGCVVASPDWATQIVIQRPAHESAAIADLAVFMHQAGAGDTSQLDQTIEAARLALTEGRNLFADGRGAQLCEQLVDNVTDPIAGIIGGHLLLRAMAGGTPGPDRVRQFDSLVTRLRSLVGHDHPDVEALSLRCTDLALATDRPFTAPPMFRLGWELLTQATYLRAELVPMELWQRVHASVALSAFFIWAADDPTRSAHIQQLSRWISDLAKGPAAPSVSVAEHPPVAAPLPQAARDAAYRQQVPAAAAAELWADIQRPATQAAAGTG